ncbi:MAG: histidine phosphatase family protein [Kyrpidia sp.]|nr:histidine phosphatase family protein [Kyrpidia sp.]
MPETGNRGKPHTLVCLVRHGETAWNREQRLQGHRDIPLSDLGRRQAEAVGERLARERWDRIYSSDLARARETAQIIARLCGAPVTTDPRLRERSYGRLEGLTREEISRFSPKFAGHGWEHEADEVEPWEQMADRGQDALEEITADHGGRRVIVVSHGGWIRAVVHRLFPAWELSAPIDNTALTVLRRAGETWHLVSVNDTAHLPDLRIKNG